MEGKIIITLESTEHNFDYEPYGVSYESENKAIIDAIAPALSELSPGFDLIEEYDDGNFTVKKVDSSHNTYIFPKSTAG